jgi:hypothetical protein
MNQLLTLQMLLFFTGGDLANFTCATRDALMTDQTKEICELKFHSKQGPEATKRLT